MDFVCESAASDKLTADFITLPERSGLYELQRSGGGFPAGAVGGGAAVLRRVEVKAV